MAPAGGPHAAIAAFAALAALPAAAAAAECDIGIVGAAAGGAYVAWRAAVAGKSVCVFERAARPGGRIHSLRGQGPKRDLTVEAGGYRFAPTPVVERFKGATVKIATPLTAAIIKELGLPTAIYNPNPHQWDHGMHKIVDARGQDAGFLTFIERMLQLAMDHGAQVRYSARVVAVVPGGSGGVLLRLAGGEEVAVGAAVMNVPQRPLLELLRGSGPPVASTFPRPLYNPVAFDLIKLYVHYNDSWWRNDLGLTSGPFYNREPAPLGTSYVSGLPMERPAPLQGQYHDGDVRCDLPGGRCRGFLQAYYGGSNALHAGGVEGPIAYYAPFVDGIREDAALHVGDQASHHRELLELVHTALVQLHKPGLDKANATARVAAMRPTGAVLSIWGEGVAGIQAACHAPKRRPDGSMPLPGQLAKEALQPLPGLPVYVANEAYGPMSCFAEGSLAMAEMALKRLNVSRPSGGWLDEELFDRLLEPETNADRVQMDPFLIPGFATAPESPEPSSVVAI